MLQRLLLLALLGLPASAAAADRPNVLFIAIDDLNDWVGCLGGHPQTRTPNLDRLAERGVLFTNAHCAAPLCNPSRTAVMTGLMPTTSGVHGNEQDWRLSPHVANRPTLGAYFRQHGYETAAGGKIFHANHGGECGALQGGHGGLAGFDDPGAWDERFPAPGLQLAKPSVPPGQNYNGLDIWHWDWGPIDVADARTQDGQTVAWAEEFLRREHDRPFFLAVGIYRPHGPWYVPGEWFDPFPEPGVTLPVVREGDLDDVPRIGKRWLGGGGDYHARVQERGLWRNAVRAYLANVHFADAMLGRVLTALEASPHADDTLVVLWSDHGWHLGEKQRWHKSTLWEEATRVPLLFAGPGVSDSGKCRQPASLVDLYPTLVDLCGLPPRDDLDGLSLAPQLRDPATPRERPAVTSMRKSHAVRTDRWRFIRYADGSTELYDHARDPNEWTNLAGRPETAEIERELAQWLPDDTATPEPPARKPGPGSEPGFRPIFNGYDLTSWEGDPTRWSVEDGAIVGRTTAEAPLENNTFLIWRGAEVGDFDLRLEFQLEANNASDFANSGVQYRSRVRPEFGEWALGGYQADIDFTGKYAGILYEEKGRGILALPGEVVRLTETDTPATARRPRSTKEVVDRVLVPQGPELVKTGRGEWNEYEIVARGPQLEHRLNGSTTVRVTDADPAHRSTRGLVGLQLHRGEPMTVRFRHLRIRTIGSLPPRDAE